MSNSSPSDMDYETLESGDPRDDNRAYRRALGHFATGVTIITARHGDQLGGMTANSFSSVSLDPPLIQWALGKSSHSLGVFSQAAHFAVNVLASDQVDLAGHFARSGGDKFAGMEWQPGLGDAPLLQGVAATFECRAHSSIDAGDHFIMLGEVQRFSRNGRPLLLFAHGRFGLAVDYPAVAKDSDANGSGSPITDTTLGLLWDAFSRMSTGFQAERDAEGMTITQGRVLSIVERHPGATTEAIAHRAYVSPAAVDDAVAVLLELGFAARRPGGGCIVTPVGLERVLSLRRRAAAFEARQFAHLTPEELETARKVLKSLGAPDA